MKPALNCLHLLTASLLFMHVRRMLANRFDIPRGRLDEEATAMHFGGKSAAAESYALPSLALKEHSIAGGLSDDEASDRDRSTRYSVRSSERSAKYKPECFLAAVPGPCLLRPIPQDIPSQRVNQMFLNGSDFVVYVESVENSVVYLPCGTQMELHNETVIWEHNFTTMSVMGTLFTMDTRLDAASDYNEYEPCEDEAALTSSPFADHRPPPRGLPEVKSVRFRVQMWELVIRDLQQSDSGVYTCRLTGGTPQSIKYYLSVKSDETNHIFSRKGLIRIEAPRFARKNSAGRFVCAMETTHRNSSRVLLDWFRARKTSPAPRGPPFHFPASRYRRQTVELIESQPWNNITIYKQIVGERNDNLLLEAVLIMHRTSSQHTATYECQAGEILSGRISRVYDSLAFNFTVLPQWQFVHQMEQSGYCLVTDETVPSTSFADETRQVLSDSPTERHVPSTHGRQLTVVRLSDAFNRLTTAFPHTSTAPCHRPHSHHHLASILLALSLWFNLLPAILCEL